VTPQEQARRELARRELARRELERRKALDVALPKAPRESVTFAPQADVEAAAKAEREEVARARVEAPGVFSTPGAATLQLQEAEEAKVQKEQERKRQRVGVPGVEGPVDVQEEGIFRPSRIETVETFTPFPAEGTGVLLDPPRPEVIAAADLPAPFDPLTMKPTLRRMYRDPETGTYTEPTLGQEFRENFALQTERTETALRDRQAALAEERRQLDEALAKGEDIPFFRQYVGSPISGVLTRPGEGKGIVETELGSALRSVLSWGSAAAADAYFRGLGYEVDEQGNPLDPEDFGYEVAKFRRSWGIPDVVTPFGGLKEAADFYGTRAGLDRSTINTLQNALDSVPQLAIPLAGVATESTKRKVTTFDPEGRRRVEEVEVPYPWEDPRGFLEAEAMRITQNVAKGRTWGDEYLDVEGVRDYYAHTTGDPDNAYIAGLLPEIVIPGPEILVSLPGYAFGVASDVLRVSRNLKAVRKAERAVKSTRQASKLARATGKPAGEVAALDRAAAAAVQKHADLVDASTDYDPTLLRNVVSKATGRVVGKKAPDQAEAVRTLLRGPDAPETMREVADTLRRVLPEEDVGRVTSLTYRNLPGDFVSLTDTIAVPRRQLPAARKALKAHRASAFVKSTTEVMDDLYGLARRMPEGPAKQQVLRTYVKARNALDGATEAGRGYGGMDRGLRRQVQTAVQAAARELGEANPRDLARRFDQRRPADLPIGDGDLARDLARYDSWDDVPADLRRQAVDTYDIAVAPTLAKGARLTRDVTRAQMFFRTAEQGMKNRGLLMSRMMDSPAMRRALAGSRLTGLQTETKAAADIAREVQLAGRTSLRTLRTKLDAALARTGNMDEAVDEVLASELSQAGEGPQQAWEALWGTLYGDAVKDDLLAAVKQDGALRVDSAGELADFPTVDSARAIDRLYSDLEGVLPGITPDLANKAERVGLGGVVTPNITNAMLKVIFEEGIRKNLAARKRLTGAVQTAVDDAILGTDFTRATAATLAERVERSLPFPARGVTLPPEESGRLGNRVQVYDRSAGFAEKMLAEGAEGLVVGLDDIPVRERAAVWPMVKDAYDYAVGTRRNIAQRVQYGYLVPNLPVQVGRVMQMAVVPLVTIGARDALGGFNRLGQRALSSVTRRRVLGGGITDPNGVYYSPKVLDDMADEYGLGITRVETERVGSLAADLRRDAQRAARAAEDPDNADLIAALDEADPFSKGFFLRAAEAVELNYRKSVFEMALARGDAPQEAAELARRSQFDYQEVPDAVRQTLGRYFGGSAFLYRVGAEGLAGVIERPQIAGRVLRGMRAKAEAQDPFNIHGDKALKSLGMVPKGDDGDVYYLPEVPALQPVEGALGTVRAVDNLLADVRFATDQLETARGALPEQGVSAGTAIQYGGEVIAPAVMAALDRFKGGQEYRTTDVPEAEPMSDEKAFWAWMVIANNRDPEHTNGAWSTFTTLAPVNQVKPTTPEMASTKVEGAWKVQPPDGIPHYLHDVIDGEPVYFAAEPSDEALRFIRFARMLDVADLDRALPFYAILSERERTPAAKSIFTEGRLPTTLPEAAATTVLGTGPGDVARGLEGQAETVRDIRESIEIE
jgi:hypothetical protein